MSYWPSNYDYLEKTMNEGYNGIAHDFETLRYALKQISEGQVMSGIWTHAETVVRYQEIARKALNATRCHTRKPL